MPTLVILLLLLELFFRFIVPASERPQSFFDENDLIYKFDTTATREGVHTIGKFAQQRGRWRINNYGWNSPIDYVPQGENNLIAILGDSYIEATQVDVDKSYPSLLRKELGENYDIYSFGKSGAPLSEYLNYSRYINKYFNPDILIFNVIHNDFDASILKLAPEATSLLTLNIEDSTITENLPKANSSLQQYNWKRRMIYKSALFRYLYINLHVRQTLSEFRMRKNNQERFNANVEVTKLENNKSLITKSVNYILGKIHEENPNKRIIFVFDAPRDDIYNDNLKNSEILFLHEILEKCCLKYSFEYIDLTKPMENDYNENSIKFNSELDGHWNEYGHDFVFKQLSEYLKNANFHTSDEQKTNTDNL